MKPEAYALKESAISMVIAYINSTEDIPLDRTDPDVRAIVADTLESLQGGVLVDATSWPHVKNRMLYDVYLMSREEAGTITKTDKIRTGLTISMFADPFEFNNHCKRISDHRLRAIGPHSDIETKVCTQCNQVKTRDKFRKKGGSVCNACQCTKYRQRKYEDRNEHQPAVQE